jgi:hypothetical protein
LPIADCQLPIEKQSNSQATSRSGLGTVFCAIIALAICSAAAAVRSRGFLESDGCMHYLLARHALEQPFYFTDVWGRPLCTALFAIPAHLGGLLGVRLISLAAAIGCGLVAFRLAIGQGYRWPALALIFTLGQPLLFLHSFSEMTELPFALLVGLGMLAYQSRRWAALAIVAALLPLGRPEGFLFALLAAAALIARRRWIWLAILPVGLIAWSIAGHVLSGPADAPWWGWLIDHWPWGMVSEYGHGSPLHFLARLPVLVGPFALPAMWIGMGRNLWPAIRGRLLDWRPWLDCVIAALPLALLVGHSLLYAMGKLSSSGELRYLLVVAPLWGLLCARGWELVFGWMNWSRPLSWAALAVVAPGLVNFVYRVLPLEPPANWLEAQRFVQWYQAHAIHDRYPRVLTNHPGIFYYMDVSPSDRRFVEPWLGTTVDHPPAGVLLLWDPRFSPVNADPALCVSLDRVMAAGWINDWKAQWLSNVNNPPPWANYKITPAPPAPRDNFLPDTPMLWHIFLSPRDGRDRPAPAVARQLGSARWLETPGNPQPAPPGP